MLGTFTCDDNGRLGCATSDEKGISWTKSFCWGEQGRPGAGRGLALGITHCARAGREQGFCRGSPGRAALPSRASAGLLPWMGKDLSHEDDGGVMARTAAPEDGVGRVRAAALRRDRLREQMLEEVRAAAREIIRAEGVEALTLAEIARRVGVTPAALYRYFETAPWRISSGRPRVRSLLNSPASCRRRSTRRTRTILPDVRLSLHVFRRWALAHQQEFALLFGTPTSAAGEAQFDVTSDWVRQLAGVWGPEFVRLWAARPYPILTDDELDPRLREQLAEYRTATGVDIPLGRAVAHAFPAGARFTARSLWRYSTTSLP